MSSYYFILGRENKISQKELLLVLASFGVGLKNDYISIIAEDILEIKLNSSPDDVADLLKILGGTVKIYQKIASGDDKIVDLLRKEDFEKKMIFGLSDYSVSRVDTFAVALSAKKALKKSLRVIAGKEKNRLSSAQSFQYKMDCGNIEYGLFDTGIGKLIAVQDINEWTRHDYGKPRSDAASGMLPPKLARMMVNLALGQVENSKYEYRSTKQTKSNSNSINSKHVSDFGFRYSDLRPLVVDPFCGSGNILLEALSVSCDVIGSDISEKAVNDTKANLEWFLKLTADSLQLKADVFQTDATKFDFLTIDRDFVVVTEPYLGRPRRHKLTIEEEKEAIKESSKLYQDFLRNLKLTALPAARLPDGQGRQVGSLQLKAICIVFPLFELANGKKLSIFSECLDFIRQIGYDIICPPCLGETSSCKAGPPMEYGRDYQVVKREIVLLKIRNTNIEARNKFEIIK